MLRCSAVYLTGTYGAMGGARATTLPLPYWVKRRGLHWAPEKHFNWRNEMACIVRRRRKNHNILGPEGQFPGGEDRHTHKGVNYAGENIRKIKPFGHEISGTEG